MLKTNLISKMSRYYSIKNFLSKVEFQNPNVPQSLLDKIGCNIYLQKSHPLYTIKHLIESRLPNFYIHDSFHSPIVSIENNFDDLLIPKDHPGRSRSDTYYVNDSHVLRTHTSAHQTHVLEQFKHIHSHLITADVYRRDEIDASHYPVFHQMEGIHTFDSTVSLSDSSMIEPCTMVDSMNINQSMNQSMKGMGTNIKDVQLTLESNSYQSCHSQKQADMLTRHLKKTIEHVLVGLFSKQENLQIRWIEAYFPFTQPSWEVEVFYQGKWLEVLGCGIIRQEILNKTGNAHKTGWAFGLGLERLAMVLFDIPDIRLFWSKDPRFTSQFKESQLSTFKPFSKYPSCYKDISFWITPEFHDNDFSEIVRDVAGDVVESVTLIDSFVHPKTMRASKCYRINYCSMEKTLLNEQVDAIQDQVRERVVKEFNVELR